MICDGGIIELFFFIGLISFILALNHYLSILLRLEFVILSLYIITSFFISTSNLGSEFLFLFLAIIILEGVFGLCLLIFISRLIGNEIVTLI